MSWWIDNKGIHVNAHSLNELKDAVEEIEWRLKSTPRSVQEQNTQSLHLMQRMIGGEADALVDRSP